MRDIEHRSEEVVQNSCSTCSLILLAAQCHPHTAGRAQKEERAHDARLASANEKIKQAGQLYEKKVKKSPANAVEEHTRYINTLGTVGPEIAQEK